MSRAETADDERGQAATELALVLPLLVLLLLTVVQVTLVARDQVLVVHAAREAAREAAVDPRPSAVRQAVGRAGGGGLQLDRLDIKTTQSGGAPSMVTVRVVHRTATDVPLIGTLVPDVEVRAKAAMRRETPLGAWKSPSKFSEKAGFDPSRSEPSDEQVGRGPPR